MSDGTWKFIGFCLAMFGNLMAVIGLFSGPLFALQEKPIGSLLVFVFMLMFIMSISKYIGMLISGGIKEGQKKGRNITATSMFFFSIMQAFINSIMLSVISTILYYLVGWIFN